MHSYVFNTCPISFHNTWTINSERDGIPNLRNNTLFELPHPRIELFKRSPFYTLPALWNDLNECKFYEIELHLKSQLENFFWKILINKRLPSRSSTKLSYVSLLKTHDDLPRSNESPAPPRVYRPTCGASPRTAYPSTTKPF